MRTVFNTLVIVGLIGHMASLTADGVGEATALQGLRTNTLVAGKTTAFRLFAADATVAAAIRIHARVTRPDGSQFAHSWSRSEAVIVPQTAATPGSIVLLRGRDDLRGCRCHREKHLEGRSLVELAVALDGTAMAAHEFQNSVVIPL